MRGSLNDETKAHLRKLWLRVLVILFGAFGLILAISALSGEETVEPAITCAPEEMVCTLEQAEVWLGFGLPPTATHVMYASSDPFLWLRFDAPAADVPNFVQNTGVAGDLVNAPFSAVDPPADLAPWWTATPEMGGVYVDTATRQMSIRIDQQPDAPWTVHIAALRIESDE